MGSNRVKVDQSASDAEFGMGQMGRIGRIRPIMQDPFSPRTYGRCAAAPMLCGGKKTLFRRFEVSGKQEAMKARKPNPQNVFVLARVGQISICIAGVLYLSGCATPSYKKADSASSSLQKAAMEINAENHAIDATMNALDDLVNKPAADLRPQFARFNASLNWLEDSSKRAEKAANEANAKSQDYFRTWDKEMASIHYEAVRDQSVSRKTQVSDELNTVDQRYRQNQAVVEPLIAYLRDIRTSLSVDLTAGGIASVKPLAENAQQNARKVQSALAQLSDDLAETGTRMSALVTQDAQAKGGVGDATQTTQQRAESTTR